MSDRQEPAIERAKERVLSDGDRVVWVVERNPGSGWRVSAVLASWDAAEQYREDLFAVMNHYPEEFPEEFQHETEVRIRSGSRGSPTKMFESYPPEEA